jgi:integrase/recombinase XerC
LSNYQHLPSIDAVPEVTPEPKFQQLALSIPPTQLELPSSRVRGARSSRPGRVRRPRRRALPVSYQAGGEQRSVAAVPTVVEPSLRQIGPTTPASERRLSLRQARDGWLRRVVSAGRSASTLTAYRIALDDLIAWVEGSGREVDVFAEETVVAYLDAYRLRAKPAEATYYRRFTLLRRFFRWVAGRADVPDPFVDLEAPKKPSQEADWLTRAEFVRLLEAAAAPSRRLVGLAERDRLVLLALVTTGLRRSELIALDWRDVDLDGPQPSLLVRCGKGGKPRRQPLAPQLASELARARSAAAPGGEEPVFTGLSGGRLQPTILANIIRRAATRSGLEKRVTAHTLRHTAATWLRQATGDARLVAEYLGHADLSTVSRYAHVAGPELHAAAKTIAERAGLQPAGAAASVVGAVRSDAGEPQSDSRAPAPSGSRETAESCP